ncbi:MAG: SDR family oxidoreductase [Lachnospiraceae bacterium]|nr:SDR family oxidoreductase [Lachnospiraceae bacterium]
MSYRELEFSDHTICVVTGGAGFIGSNLCEALLDKGCIVRCLDNLSTGHEKNMETFRNHPDFTFVMGDICDEEACRRVCEGADYVFHQAAWGSVPRSIEMPSYYEKVNIGGTLHMLDAAREKGVRRFVYASSSSVYGDAPELPKTEERVGKPLSPYALTKKTDEEYARLYAELYGLETVGLRYFNVFGRRQDPNGAYAAVIPRFIRTLLSGETPVIYGDGTQSRDFTYIENVIEANIKAALSENELKGEAFNIAFGERTTLNEIYRILCSLLGIQREPVYGKPRAGDIAHSHASIEKAVRLLGYHPEYSFEQGIRETVGWYRAQL